MSRARGGVLAWTGQSIALTCARWQASVLPPSAPTTTGNVTATVKTISGGKTVVDPAGYRIDLYYASSGAEQTVQSLTAPFSFANVPMGIHAIYVVKTVDPDAGTVVAQDTVVIRPGSTTAVELWF